MVVLLIMLFIRYHDIYNYQIRRCISIIRPHFYLSQNLQTIPGNVLRSRLQHLVINYPPVGVIAVHRKKIRKAEKDLAGQCKRLDTADVHSFASFKRIKITYIFENCCHAKQFATLFSLLYYSIYYSRHQSASHHDRL